MHKRERGTARGWWAQYIHYVLATQFITVSSLWPRSCSSTSYAWHRSLLLWSHVVQLQKYMTLLL